MLIEAAGVIATLRPLFGIRREIELEVEDPQGHA